MPIKAVLIDVSDTLLDARDQPIPGVVQMLERLDKLGIKAFTASFHLREGQLARQLLGIPYDRVLTTYTVNGQRKGSRAYVEHVCQELGVKRHEVLYLGDSEQDMREAVNSGLLFFVATWAPRHTRYGVPITSPAQFVEIVERFFLKEHLWYFSLDRHSTTGNRHFLVRALMDPETAQDTGLKDLLKSKGQRGLRRKGTFTNLEELNYHLLASIYLEGLQTGTPIWCLYPSSDGTYTSVLDPFVQLIAQHFDDKYQQTLIQRPQAVPSSSYDRARGNYPPIDRQLQSIHLDPGQQNYLAGKSVIVLDDFTTYAHAFETSRNLLFKAGVTTVICIAVGKFNMRRHPPELYHARTPSRVIAWDPFALNPSLHEGLFQTRELWGSINRKALRYY